MAVDEKSSDRRVTQDDVARRVGVTRSVVSYVLNGNLRAVAPETRDRVLRAIEELGYRPNQFAQSLGLGRDNPRASRQIGIVLPSVNLFLRPYYTEILAGIHLEAHEADHHIRFIRFFDELRNPVLFNSLIHDEEVCGLLLIALDQCVHSVDDQRLVDQIRQRIDPIVCLEWKHPDLPSVFFDRHEAAAKATRHLLDLGHRQVAYLGESDERVSGFVQVMVQSGASPSALTIDQGNDMASGYEAAERVFRAHPDVTAVVAGSDEVAFGILRWLNAHGHAVPARVALASIDNIAMAAFTTPPLTTVNVQKEMMGRQAVQMLLRSVKDGTQGPVTLLLPTALVVRESSGATWS